MKAVETLIAADYLAEFANLNPEDVATFRLKIQGSDFIPDDVEAAKSWGSPTWWEYEPTDGEGHPYGFKQWQFVQQLLHKAWAAHFDLRLFDQLALFTAVFTPMDILDVWLGPEEDGAEQRPLFANLAEVPEEHGYHLAIRYLIEHPWAAKNCEECGGYFVANHNARKFCSVASGEGVNCSKKSLNRSKRNYWEANKDRIRPTNKQKEKE